MAHVGRSLTLPLATCRILLTFVFTLQQLNSIKLKNDAAAPEPVAGKELPPIEEQVEETEKMTVAEKSLLQKVLRNGLVANKHDLEIQRKDPNSPLYSVKSFEALNL